jgi:ribose transport system substrate-binding protein
MIPAAFVVATTLLALAACSGSGETGSTGGSAPAADSAAVDAAVERVAQYSAEQDPIEIEPLPAPPEEGLTVAITSCTLPVCHTLTDAAAEAAEAIGWTVVPYESELTPESYVATWDQMMQSPPDLIAYIPFAPDALIEEHLAKTKELGIPVVVAAPAGDRPDKEGPVYASYNGYTEFFQSGGLMGDVVVADGGTGETTVFVWDPALSLIWDPIKAGFDEQMRASGSEADVLEASNSGIGTAVPGQLVSYLQSHPDVEYVVLALADYSAGIPEALESAGLADRVKIVSRAPQAANLANVKAGKEFASVGEENSSNGWRAIDGLARLAQGMTPDDTWFEPAGWAQIYTADTVTQTTEPPTTPGSPDAFLTAWGVE